MRPGILLRFCRKYGIMKGKNIRRGGVGTVNEGLQEYAHRLRVMGQLSSAEYAELIRFRDGELLQLLCSYTEQIRKSRPDSSIMWVGTIDLTSYCKNNCYYCGMRRDNRFAERYRMSTEEVVACCLEGLEHGISCFLLQGGEDLWYTPDVVADMIRRICSLSEDVTVLLSLGEKSRAVYQKWRDAGATGYILCHQTTNDSFYRKLHPAQMSLLRRKQCLWELKELGYLVGSGFMIGTPYQRVAELADEFAFLRQLAPDIMMVDTFLAANGTPFEQERNGMPDLTYLILSLLRLSFPDIYLPVSQTVELTDREGVLRGVQAGADMVLADLTPEPLRRKYHCFKGRLMRGQTGAGKLEKYRRSLQEAHYEIADIHRRIGQR